MVKEDEELIEKLKRSREKVGEIQPVLYTEDNRLAEGYHRLKAGWESEATVKGAKGRLGAGVIRVITNTIRRSPSEDDFRLVGEALRDDYGLKPGEIGPWIIKNTGLSQDIVNKYLPQEFKSETKVKAGRKGGAAWSKQAKTGGTPSPVKASRIKITEYEEKCPECNAPLIARIKGKIKPRGFELAKA